MVVANAGPSDALGAQVVDLFPPALVGVTWRCADSGGGSCTASGSGDLQESVDLPVGACVTFTATGTVDPGATGTLNTSPSVLPTFPSAGAQQALPAAATTGGDPNPGNNTATDVDLLTPQADLAIPKDDGTAVAILGQMTYTIVVGNPGPSSVVSGGIADSVDLSAGASVTEAEDPGLHRQLSSAKQPLATSAKSSESSLTALGTLAAYLVTPF